MSVDPADQGTPDDPGDEWWDDADGEIRGWIPPDDRLWRHPSESGAQASGGPAARPPTEDRPAAPIRPGSWIVGGAAACVVLALVATGLAVLTTGSSDQGEGNGQVRAAWLAVPTTEAGVDPMPGATAITGMVSNARPSLVALAVGLPTGSAVGTGIVVASGGMIVTASQLVAGSRSVTVIEGNGTREAADVVGIDSRSGLAVLRIADDLPAARFDTADPTVGSVAVATALHPGGRAGAPPSTKVYAGTVASTGRAAGSDGATHLLSASVIEAPLATDDVGCPLLDPAGQVSGLLEWTAQSGGTTSAVFLPAEVVLGVAQQLVTSGEVDHGWVGIETSDAGSTDPTSVHPVTSTAASQPADGARLDAVDENGPAAAAGLRVGDVVVGVDGNPVHSKSELDARLYPDAPGAVVDLSLVRNGTTLTLPVVLADGGPDGPAGESSP